MPGARAPTDQDVHGTGLGGQAQGVVGAAEACLVAGLVPEDARQLRTLLAHVAQTAQREVAATSDEANC
ncbi:hypothetical protein [Streptomyces sp. NBC_01716]|uniref:hypothetical protein n=1 Tax=Streptomyces sp. NBC_01716 TaxID=2975917 RepID=UPI002E344E47|nr:hypothetical protein [Streptomyces sp. NBC_01716]